MMEAIVLPELAPELLCVRNATLHLLIQLFQDPRNDPNDDGRFRQIIQLVTMSSPVTLGLLAETCQVSVATVSRWSVGKAAPPRYARGVVLQRLKDLLINMLR